MVKLNNKPFIIGYQEYSAMLATQEWNELMILHGEKIQAVLDDKDHTLDIVEYINKINALRLRRSKKYLFDDSALQLHTSVMHNHNTIASIEYKNKHIWLETQEEIHTGYGDMRAMFFCDACPLEEIHAAAPSHKDHSLHNDLIMTYAAHKNRYALEIVDNSYNLLFDFTFDMELQQWIFLPSHKCPVSRCIYPTAKDLKSVMIFETLAVCKPCEYCIKACDYFATWLVAALAMVHGEYALHPYDESFEVREIAYTTTGKTAVGKGKNKRLITSDIKRNIEYTLISYDVTRQKRSLTVDETREVERAEHTNWLVTTPSGNIIWKRKTIKPYSRKYPTRKDGTRKDGLIELKDEYKRWVPMLRVPNRTIIEKVTASKW